MEQNIQNPQIETQQSDNVNNENENKEACQPKPDTNLALAIFTTVCCCLPFGIYAIVKASSVNTLYLSGNHEAACLASAEAKKWSIYGIIAGVVVSVLYGIVNVMGILAA